MPYNIIFLGDEKAGKTELIAKIAAYSLSKKKKFQHGFAKTNVTSASKLYLNLWDIDTYGLFIIDAPSISIAVYCLNLSKPIAEAPLIIADLKQKIVAERLIFVGTKNDQCLPGNLELIKRISSKYKADYLLTSAHENTGITELIKKIKQKIKPVDDYVRLAFFRSEIPDYAANFIKAELKKLIEKVSLEDTVANQRAKDEFVQNCEDYLRDKKPTEVQQFLKLAAKIILTMLLVGLICLGISCSVAFFMNGFTTALIVYSLTYSTALVVGSGYVAYDRCQENNTVIVEKQTLERNADQAIEFYSVSPT